MQRTYQSIPHPLYREVRDYLTHLLERGWIQNSSSEYLLPLVCIMDSELFFTRNKMVDYKTLDMVLKNYPQPKNNYHKHSGELEFFTLKWAVTEHFRDYLYYAKHITVYTDNNPLSYVLSTAKLIKCNWASLVGRA